MVKSSYDTQPLLWHPFKSWLLSRTNQPEVQKFFESRDVVERVGGKFQLKSQGKNIDKIFVSLG